MVRNCAMSKEIDLSNFGTSHEKNMAKRSSTFQALQTLKAELHRTLDHFLKCQQRFQEASAEEVLSQGDHHVLDQLIHKTRSHPSYHKRYTKPLRGFPTLDEIQPLKPEHVAVQQLSSKGYGLPKDSILSEGGVERVLAMDCEMIETTEDSMALARVSAVNLLGETVIDILVLPCHWSFVEDCRTFITGIHLEGMFVQHVIPLQVGDLRSIPVAFVILYRMALCAEAS